MFGPFAILCSKPLMAMLNPKTRCIKSGTFFAHKWDSKMKFLHSALCTSHGRKIGLISFEMKARKARRAFEPSIPSIERAEPVSKCFDRSSFELRLGTRASLCQLYSYASTS